MVLRSTSEAFKITAASLVAGILLAQLGIRPSEILADLGTTPERLYASLVDAVRWLVPHLVLGAIVVMPIWIVIRLFRSPRG